MQNTRKCCATHPSQQSTYVDSLGRSRQEIGTIWGGGDRKGSRWRQLSGDHLLHSINSILLERSCVTLSRVFSSFCYGFLFRLDFSFRKND